MDELTYEEKLKLDNSREHLRIVLNNLRIANETLTVVLGEITSAKKALGDLLVEKESLVKAISEIKITYDERGRVLDNKEASLIERETIVDNKELEARNRLSQIEETILKEEINHSIALSKFTKEKDIAIGDIMRAEHELDGVLQELREYEEKTNLASQNIKKLEDEIIRLSAIKLDQLKDIEDTRRSFDSEKESITNEINSEREKIKRPLELLLETNNEVNRKIKNLTSIGIRLTRQYKQMNPGKILPLELQEKK